ncbi:MAG: exonuclease domain-containing protein, partial [Heliobacteriaceae bacterium]|nr:exonuclease domain-containing protein [Heliobacteriaceae bacterium]
MLKDMILIDIETQDFNVEAGIFEVACLVVQDYEVIDQLYLGKEIEDWDRERVYGYGFYDISNDEAYVNTFKSFLDKYNFPLVAHNCPFDRKFLVYYDWIPVDYPCYCSMRAIRYSISLESYSLANLVRHFGISSEVTHKAFDDIMNVFEIIRVLKPKTWVKVGKRKTNKRCNTVDVSIHGFN